MDAQDHSEAPFPEHIGRYNVLLPLASGGMGSVYLARVRGLGGFEREVALKLLHSHLKREPGFADDLIEEAKLAGRIRHPNVVTVIDVGEDPFGIFLVMDYVEGDTLAGLQRRATTEGGRLPVRVGLRILMDALSGLHAAHELSDEKGAPLNLVHRDFTPQNILVGIDGVARLSDFGVAKAATRVASTNTGMIKGKIAYMAPEQAKGQPLDRRCDVWAAGVVAWQIVTGERLFSAGNEVSTLLKIVTSTPPRLRELVPGVAPQLDEAVASALTRSRDARCGSALAFRLALAAACRTSDQLAEAEEVAEWVSRLAGAKLAERRVRVVEVEALRARMGKLATSETDWSNRTPHGPLRLRNSLSPEAPTPGSGEIDITETPTPGSEIDITVEYPWKPPLELEATRTDTTSVSTGSANSVGGLATFLKTRRGIVGAGSAVGVIALLAMAWGSRREGASEVTPDSRNAASAEPPSLVASAVPDDRQVTPSIPAPDVTSPLAVHANAIVSSLRVNGHPVDMARPASDFVADLTADETAHVARLEATSADGRHATGTLAIGETAVRITFPTFSAPRPPTPVTRPTAAAPLAASPYGTTR